MELDGKTLVFRTHGPFVEITVRRDDLKYREVEIWGQKDVLTGKGVGGVGKGGPRPLIGMSA